MWRISWCLSVKPVDAWPLTSAACSHVPDEDAQVVTGCWNKACRLCTRKSSIDKGSVFLSSLVRLLYPCWCRSKCPLCCLWVTNLLTSEENITPFPKWYLFIKTKSIIKTTRINLMLPMWVQHAEAKCHIVWFSWRVHYWPVVYRMHVTYQNTIFKLFWWHCFGMTRFSCDVKNNFFSSSAAGYSKHCANIYWDISICNIKKNISYIYKKTLIQSLLHITHHHFQVMQVHIN